MIDIFSSQLVYSIQRECEDQARMRKTRAALQGIQEREDGKMSVARVTEISSTSTQSFEDAIQQGIARATKTLRGVRSAWIKEQEVQVANDKVTSYKVIMKITFILEDAG